VSFEALIVYVASERVFVIVVVYFLIDPVRKLLDTPSYASPIDTIIFIGSICVSKQLGTRSICKFSLLLNFRALEYDYTGSS